MKAFKQYCESLKKMSCLIMRVSIVCAQSWEVRCHYLLRFINVDHTCRVLACKYGQIFCTNGLFGANTEHQSSDLDPKIMVNPTIPLLLFF